MSPCATDGSACDVPGETLVADLGLRVNVHAVHGTDVPQIVLSLQNADGSFVNVTGANVTAEVRRLPTDASPAASFAVGVGPTEITLDMAAAVVNTLPGFGASLRDAAGLYVWRCLIVFPNATRRQLAYGEFRAVRL